MKQIQKVRQSRESVMVIYRESSAHGSRTITMETTEQPAAAFTAALQSLKTDVLQICDLPVEYGAQMRVTSVSFTNKKDVMGAVITATKKLKDCNAPLNINTPHLPAAPADHKSQSTANLLSDDCVKRLEKVLKETEQLIDGKKLQTDIEDGPSKN